MIERGNYWPKDVIMPVVLPQPTPENERFVVGCVCPIGANLACENPLCPRKNTIKDVRLHP